MRNWIDFETIKRRIPITAALERYGIQGLRRSGKTHLRGRCPLHGGEGRDTFHVDTAEQVFHCFSCQAGGSVLDLVSAMEQCGLREAAERLADWQALPPSQAESVSRTAKRTVTKKSKPIPPLGFRLREVDSGHPYLASRGIQETTAVEFGVGYYSGPGLMQHRLVIPIEDEVGRLVGYCGRSLDGSEPRYKYPLGFPKSQLVFNLHRAVATGEPGIVLVEGFFDCLRVYEAGFPCVAALMGSALYEEQCRIVVEHFQNITLMLDGDGPGRRASSAVASVLEAHCPVNVIKLPDGTQPDQLTTQALQRILGRERRPVQSSIQ